MYVNNMMLHFIYIIYNSIFKLNKTKGILLLCVCLQSVSILRNKI